MSRTPGSSRQLGRDRQLAPLRHARGRPRARVPEDEHGVARRRRGRGRRCVPARSSMSSKTSARPRWRSRLRRGGAALDDRAARGEVARGGRRSPPRARAARSSGAITSRSSASASAISLAERAAGDRERVDVEQRRELASARPGRRRRGGGPPSDTRRTAGRSRARGVARESSSKSSSVERRRRPARRSRAGGRPRSSSRRAPSARVIALSKRARRQDLRRAEVLARHLDGPAPGRLGGALARARRPPGSRPCRAASCRAPRRSPPSSTRCPSRCSGRARG